MSISELASLIGIHPNRLHKHLSHLWEISALSWRITQGEKLVLSFPEEHTVKAENHASAQIFPGSTLFYSQDRETDANPSCFPPQILGYLSYQEEPKGFSALESREDLMIERVIEVAD
jgi:hypothetical protein